MKFHLNAKKKLINILIDLISKLTLEQSQILISEQYVRHITALTTELSKINKLNISYRDIISIVYSKLYKFLEKNGDTKINTSSFEEAIGGKENSKILAEEVSAFFESIPRNYTIKIPLPSINHDFFKDKEKHKDLWFKYEEYNVGVLSLLSDEEIVDKQWTLQINLEGFINSIDSKSWPKVYLNLKKVIMLGEYLGLFYINKNKKPSSPSYFIKKEFPILNIKILDMLDNTLANTDLPYHISALLHMIELSERALSDEEFLNESFNQFKLALQGLQNDNEYARKIEAGLSWAFDAEISDNETFAYIQTFLGLEAILGFKNPKESSLVDKLADRCAYLIANNHKERESVRADFIDLYGVRSILVHGTYVELQEEDRKKLFEAKNMLRRVVFNEIYLLLKTK